MKRRTSDKQSRTRQDRSRGLSPAGRVGVATGVGRVDESVVVLPGRNAVHEVLKHRPKAVRTVYIQEGLKLEHDFPEVQCSLLPKEELSQLAGGEAHQGVVAILESSPSRSLSELIRLADGGVIVICDGIQDPQNLGTLFRVAEAFSVSGVILSSARSCSVTPTVRRASMGATELLPYCVAKNLAQAIKELKIAGYWIAGTSLAQESFDICAAPFSGPLSLVFGAEGDGMRRLTRDLCDYVVKIPLSGRMQSLNVSQSAAILLYEVRRRELSLG